MLIYFDFQYEFMQAMMTVHVFCKIWIQKHVLSSKYSRCQANKIFAFGNKIVLLITCLVFLSFEIS